ncbi:little elongation complex subunit 1 [Elgaria multicarinata webbii]|uniref:little elongation complex subunit 1 n=1 Tax=Elgaria multicarinata webbii TaxID=159646 RepID=UPI002FCCEB06
MMPGETPPAATTAGIAAEAAEACANCGALQQNLNEYVAALIALKQKIIDTDHLLTEYQQKCNELQFAKRENNTLHQQVEQMFQKLSPLKKCQEELGSVKAELEEKKSSLKIYQETHLEYVRVKDEMDKSDTVKKKLEIKVKKLEEAAAKHIQEFKRLKAEKKVLEKELKKAQEKIDGFPNAKQKKVLKNAETQSERENPVANLDKEKIKLLLEELWMCIDGSTGKSQINKNYFLEAVQNPQKLKKPHGEKPSSCSSLGTCTAHTSLTSLQIKLDSRPARYGRPIETKAMETADARNSDNAFYEDGSLEVVAQTDLAACSTDLFSKEQEELGENLRDVLKWCRPLPPLLSPIQFSPATTPDILFGDVTDSSDDEMDHNAQMLESIIEKCGQDEPIVETRHEKHSAESWNKPSSFSVGSANSDSQESTEKLRKLKNEESTLCSNPVTAMSRSLNERDVKSKDEKKHLLENSVSNRILSLTDTTTEIAACNTEKHNEKTVNMTKTKDRILMPDLMTINMQGREETAKPMHGQKMDASGIVHVLEESNDCMKAEEEEELIGTIEDWPQTPKGDNKQHTEEFILAAENMLVAPEKFTDGSHDVIGGGGGVEDASENIQTQSNLGKARPLDEKHGEHVTDEQNTATEGFGIDINDETLMKEKMNLNNCKFLSETEHPSEQPQQQGAQVTFTQPVKKDTHAPDASFKAQCLEENCSNEERGNQQNGAEINGEKILLNVDALRPHLHIMMATNECEKSLCHIDEITKTESERSAAPFMPTKNEDDDDQLKIAVSVTNEPNFMDIRKQECPQLEQLIDQKDSIKSLQEEPDCKSDPMLSAQASIIEDCLLLSEGLVETNNEIYVIGTSPEPRQVEEVSIESECKSKIYSISNSFQFTDISKEDRCLPSERLEENSERLKITETRTMQSLVAENSDKISAFGTVCNRNAKSNLISRSLQCGINDISQEMADWNDKGSSFDLKKYAMEEAETNYECSVTNEMSEQNMNEDPAQAVQHVLQAESANSETILPVTVRVGSESATTEFVEITASKLEVDFEVFSRVGQSSNGATNACVAPSSPTREDAYHVDGHNSAVDLEDKEANAVDSEGNNHKLLDCCSPRNNKDEVEIEQAKEQLMISETQIPVSVKGPCSGDISEALTPEAFSLNIVNTVDIFIANKSILNDEELLVPPDKKLGSPSRNCALEHTVDNAIVKERDETLCSGIRSGGVDEMKMPENAITVMNLSLSDSSPEEIGLIRKVNCRKMHPWFETPKDELGTIRSSHTHAPSIATVSCDGCKLSHDSEDPPSKDRQAAIHDTDSCTDEIIERTWEHSYAVGWTCSKENISLKPDASIAVEKSKERKTEQSISAVASLPSQVSMYNRKSVPRQSSASNPDVNGDVVAPDAKYCAASVEISVSLDFNKEKLSTEQESNVDVSGCSSNLEQSHLISCHVDNGSNISHNKECHIKNDGKVLAAKTSWNSILPVPESSNSKQHNVVSEKLESPVAVAPCTKNGAEQILKAPDPINMLAQVGVKGGHNRHLPRIPSRKGERKSRHTLLAETILANADTSTPTKHYPKTLTKIRQEMGPPLPPLLTPLIATPPRTVRPISPVMSSSSQSSLPSPLDGLISPLRETPVPPLMSPLSDTPKCKSPAMLTTPSPSETSIGQRILSSPLQFCATTPKHALPVPGRLPPSAAGGAAPPVPQENSVKILDSMYPELSARARTLNILKGNIQLSRSSSLDGKNIPQPVHQISGFKAIASTSTAFVKTGTNFKSEPEQRLSIESESGKRMLAPMVLPKSAKRPRLEGKAPKFDLCKKEFSSSISDPDVCCPADETVSLSNRDDTQSTGDCDSQLLLAMEKTEDPDGRAVTVALEKISEACFDLLPVICSHILVGNTSRVPVMRDEEKEVVYELGVAKKYLAEPALQAILKKLKKQKMSLGHSCIQSLCRVYVGICRQLGDLEKARLFCYTLLKEDFPRFDKLTLFIGNMWSEIFSSESVINKAIQLVVRQHARGEVLKCLRSYLNWEESAPVDIGMMVSSLLLAIQLCPQMEFQLSEQYGEDLKESTWEYVFAIDLLCSHQKWHWTHDNIISKELWPIMDKWIKNRKGSGGISSPSDIIVATALRLIGRLGQIGLREGFFSAVENISSVIGTFLRHAKEKDVAWGVQLAAAYALCDLGPSNPSRTLEAVRAWEAAGTKCLPPAITNGIAEVSGLLKCAWTTEDSSAT